MAFSRAASRPSRRSTVSSPPKDFGVDATYCEVNANLVYRFKGETRRVAPYLGTGLNVARLEASTNALGVEISAGETQAGLNLVAGLVAGRGRARPFVEAR